MALRGDFDLKVYIHKVNIREGFTQSQRFPFASIRPNGREPPHRHRARTAGRSSNELSSGRPATGVLCDVCP